MTYRWGDSAAGKLAPKHDAGALPDPYFRWAEHTDFRGYQVFAGWHDPAVADEDKCIRLLCRVPDPQMMVVLSASGLMNVPPIYLQPIGNEGRLAHYFSASVPKDELATLIRELPRDVRVELAQPLRDAERVARGTAQGAFGIDGKLTRFRARPRVGPALRRALDKPSRNRTPREVIAVIDFGCPFLNTRFERPGTGRATPRRSRIVALWDQGSEANRRASGTGGSAVKNWPWREPQAFAYGRELRSGVIDAMFADTHAHDELPEPDRFDEASVYRGFDYLIDYDDARRRLWHATHGAHVLDVAGGADDPLTGQPDRAADADLVFVQLPSLTAADSSGASLGAQLLDAVRYVLAVAADDAKIVINISYGSQAGPHDGSSLIEDALDEILEAHQGRVAIVLAAGNSRQKRLHARRHALMDRSALFRFEMTAGDTTDSFIEAWYLPPAQGWVLQARARGPDRLWSPWVGPDEERVLYDRSSGNDVVAMVCHDAKAQRASRHRILLALAPTAQPDDVPATPLAPGRWELEVRLLRIGPGPTTCDSVEIDVWMQRDEPGDNAGAGESMILGNDLGDDCSTLSNLATGERTLVVGGLRLSDGHEAEYSSIGPRVASALPMLLAACEEDDVNPSVRAAAVRSGECFRMNGTSVAAPVVARRLFQALVERRGDVDWPEGWKALLRAIVERDPSRVRFAPR